MSLTTPYAESYLTANGVDITFGFSFDAISENYVRCLVYMPDETVITPTFTVDIAAGEVSIVSMTTPDGELLQVPPAGATVRIFREVPEAQDATASTLQAFTSKQLEKALDKVVATVQQVDYKTTHKTVRTTETERDVWLDKLTADNDDELLKWDEDGHQITTSGLTEQGIRNETAQAIATANEAKSIATEARTTANDAKTTADEAKAIAQNAATDAETAVQKSTEATNIANEANTTADSAKTTATNADAKSDTAVSTANSASQKATTALTQSSEAMADAKDSLTKSEQAVATANDAKTTADGIDGKATTALTKSEQAVATANDAKTTADEAKATADAAVQPADLATVATSGSYNDLSNKPTIPSTLAGLTGDVSISSPAQGQHLVYDGSKWKNTASAGTVVWGGITGTLSNQSDLQTALNAKQAKGNYVTTDTAQTVTGVKTFQQGSDTALVKVQNSTAALGTTPTAEKTTQVRFDDKNGDWIGLVSSKVETDGSTSVELCVRKPDKSGSGFISVDSDASGNISFNASDGVKDTIKSWIPSASVDNKSITKNASDEIQAVGVIDANTASVVKTWTGTLAEYTALATKSDDTQYIITDDDSAGANVYTKAEVDSLVTSAVAEANAHRVIAFQAPTADNNYTWYRKYADGWVEQGGLYNRTTTGTMYMTLPVEMADTNYTAVCSCAVLNRTAEFTSNWTFAPYSTTSVQIFSFSTVYGNYAWQVSGLGA